MRLRVLELPSEVVGDDARTRFALVLDKCGDVFSEVANDFVDDAAKRLGAQGFLVFADEVDIEETFKAEPKTNAVTYHINTDGSMRPSVQVNDMIRRERMRGSNV